MTRWRELRPSDFPALNALADLVHPTLPEDDAVLAERLALYPEGCFALDGPAGLAGYLLSHPWLLGAPPRLNSLLRRLPATPDTWYLHDLALHPAVRGRGAAGTILGRILSEPRWPTWSLVAVGQSAPFWRHYDFGVESGIDVAVYGVDAAYMVRRA